MAKVDKDNWDKEYTEDELADMQDGVETYPQFEHESLAVRLLYSKLNEAIDLTNTQYDEIALNTAKTGITTAQSSAITANTAKTGISTAQSTQLTQLGKSILECGKGQLSFTYNSKTSKLEFTYTEGKTSKKGTLTLS
tara:strand:- start:2455 stop:2868 length:414 start_codon:yes stop_codon:yes gene_type:complete